jgi:predicted alpha/beta superfamily hydrolase
MSAWRDYMAGKDPAVHTVTGHLFVMEQVHSPQLNNQRDILVYLPPSYDRSAASADHRYPVIYMHDGQNLFDAATSFVGEWQVDETLEFLSGEGIEAIAVGIPNISERRVHELSPFKHAGESEGLGDAYLLFIVETVKPLIDASFRTMPDREHTGILGSSLGGLISLYAFLKHPDVFGFAGIVSPALSSGDNALFRMVEQMASIPPGRLYMDVGTNEGGNILKDPAAIPAFSRRYLEAVRQMRDLLRAKGCQQLKYVEDPDAVHNEGAWARRLPDALRFLLSTSA